MEESGNNHDVSEERLLPSTDKIPDIEECLEKAGGFGKYQWMIVATIIVLYQGMNFYIYNFAFLELIPRLECREGTSDIFNECEVEDICRGDRLIDRNNWRPDFSDSKSFRNWMTELELYCKSDFLIGLIGSSFMAGFALSGIILKFADKYGRKKIIIIGCSVQLVVVFVIFFVKNLVFIYILLFIGGLFASAKNFASYILILETCPKKYQVYVGSFILSIGPILVLLPTCFYLLFGGKSIYNILILSLIFAVLGIPVSLLIPESPRYLYERRFFEQLKGNLSFMARINGVEMQEELDKMFSNGEQEKEGYEALNQKFLSDNTDLTAEEAPIVKEFSLKEEFKKPITIINLAAVVICFSVVSFNYYLIGFYMKYVGGNIFINVIATTISECLGNFGAGFMQRGFGSKYSFIICFVAALVCSLPILFTETAYIIAISVFIGKFFVEGSFLIAYYVNSEVFPPLFVPLAFGICQFSSRAVTVLAPQVAELKPREVPIIVFLALCGVAVCVSLLLRKSKDPKI